MVIKILRDRFHNSIRKLDHKYWIETIKKTVLNLLKAIFTEFRILCKSFMIIREIIKVKRWTIYGSSTIPWAMNQIPDYNLDVFTKSIRNFIRSLIILALFIYTCKPFSICLIMEFTAVLAIWPLATCLARDKRSYADLTCWILSPLNS